MTHSLQFSFRLFATCLGAALVGATTGCTGLGMGHTHAVAVDAITGQPGTGGTSYEFVAKSSSGVPHELSQHDRALACVAAALADKGMYEAPAKTKPDMLITVDYGLGNHIPMANGPPAVEKYLHLSARKVIEAGNTTSEELWNVRTTISEPSFPLEASLPLLAAVAADYAGLDTQVEKTVSVADNSAVIARLRDAMHAGGESP